MVNLDSKMESELKRLESMKRKRLEYKEKNMIIKKDLTSVDKVQNKKIVFDYDDDSIMKVVEREVQFSTQKVNNTVKRNTLFNEDLDESEDELNFEVKKQFEGKKGQKVLDLQSRYKFDKRFAIDERFVDEEANSDEGKPQNEEVDIATADEKVKQLNILSDVLGVTLKTKVTDSDNKKAKPLGMIRFDPLQPEHEKYLAPVEAKPEQTKKTKKKHKKDEEINQPPPVIEVPKIEVSKEQFYKVSDSFKEAFAQPTTFSLRNLFGEPDNVDEGPRQDTNYIAIETSKDKKKVKNPLDRTEKNPFVYDSSDSEPDEPEKELEKDLTLSTETKAVWKENFFFTETDSRLRDALVFFSKVPQSEAPKERRELKSLVKKRLYNNDRKNQMFKKKIGGKKKSTKKQFRNKN